MSLEIRHDTDAARFVAEVEGQTSYLSYVALDERTLDYHHTFVPHPLRGRGIASALVEHALRYARDNGLRVVPSCPFVARFVQRWAQWREVVVD
jgi:uncharacterized protein